MILSNPNEGKKQIQQWRSTLYDSISAALQPPLPLTVMVVISPIDTIESRICYGGGSVLWA
ncbi:hypothetical protein HanPI659440_Chr15g0610841 [Helianthus annuus]|nr:hypothetical protein HanPI659440_Chr15g0610841 [Helianthus annuus]